MRFASEIPKTLLKELSPLHDIDFALAQCVLADKEYAEFFREQSRSGRYVILDNGFHELGHPLEVAELLQAVELCEPSVVIAPDEIDQQKKTLSWFFDMANALPPTVKCGAVMQGVSPAERAEFFMKVAKHCDMLCFPFRRPRYEWFCDLLLKIPNYTLWPPRIHLLGVNELWEIKAWREKFDELGIESKRTSIDTGKAVKFGLAGKRIDISWPTLRGAGTLDPLAKVNATHLSSVYYNIAYLRKFM